MMKTRLMAVAAAGLVLWSATAAAESTAKTVKLSGGQKVPIVTVAELNADPSAHEGLIAIDGQIGELFPEKGRFILYDYGAGHCEDPDCTGCSADEKLPIRYDKAKLKGKLPAKAERVYAIAFIEVIKGGGFNVGLKEILRDGKSVVTIGK